VLWIPLEESFPDANGMKIMPKSHKILEEFLSNGSYFDKFED